MQNRRKLRAVMAAVAATTLSAAAYGQEALYNTNIVNASAIETTGPFASAANAIPGQFLPITSSKASFPSYGVIDVSGGEINLPTEAQPNPNDIVTGVGSNLIMSFYDDVFSSDSMVDTTLFFYLVTDNTTAINTGSNSPLRYLKTTVGQTATFTGGFNGPGLTGGFAASSTVYNLGTGIYNDTLSGINAAAPYNFVYNLTLPAAAQTYVAQQVNAGGNVRLVITTNLATTGTPTEASFLSFANTNGFTPSATFDLTTSNVGSNNASTLWVGGVGTKSLPTFNLGRVIQGAPITQTLAVGNSGTDTLSFRMQFAGADGSNNSATQPIAGGSSSLITVGFNAFDTSFAAGANLTGSVNLVNLTNGTDGNATINLQAHPVSTRFLDSSSGTAAPNFGKLLVGASTAALVATFTTTNPVAGDFSTNSMTKLITLANATAAAFSVRDPFSSVTLGTITGLLPNYTQTFANTETGTATVFTVVKSSGIFGNGLSIKPGTFSGSARTYSTSFAQFVNNATGPVTAVINENLPGEAQTAEDVRVYSQWVGYDTASLVPSNSSPLLPGGTGTITNAPPNDNLYTSGSFTYNFGLRATAWVTTLSFNQTGWSQTGVTADATNTGSGTTISANNFSLAGIVANTGNTATFTTAFDPSNKLNGTYGANLAVQAENEQDISGTSVNDLPTVNFSLQGTVGIADGTLNTYGLDGGSFTASPVTTLTGTYTQTGGTALFSQIVGNGAVVLSAGSTTIGYGGGPGATFGGTVVNNSNLSIQAGSIAAPTVLGPITGGGLLSIGTATTAAYLKLNTGSHTSTVGTVVVNAGSTLDIGNNTLKIVYGSPAADPVTTITSELATAFNGGLWTGTSTLTGVITSSAAQTTGGPSLAIGINDGNTDIGVAAPNTIVLKYTLLGDANLDGLVNFNDLVTVVQNFNKAGTDWATGNFLFGPSTNFNDLVAVVQNFNKVLTPAGSSGETLGGGGSIGLFGSVTTDVPPIPEPTSLTLMGVGAAGLLARRKRARRS